jgi:ABC-type multidrug transport system permease subunit
MLKITIKDIRLFITDRRALLMTFFMPIALISIFAMAFGGENERNAKPMTLVVADLDQSPASIDLITKIDSLKSIEVKRLPADSAERLVKVGDESAMLRFNKGFGDSLKNGSTLPYELRYDPSKAAESAMLQAALVQNLGMLIGKDFMMNRAMHQSGMGNDSAAKPEMAQMKTMISSGMSSMEEAQGAMMIPMQPVIEEKQSSPGLIQAVAGTAVMMLLFGLAAMGAGLLDEKESGTLKRLLYSPMNASNVLFGKVLASILVALVQLSVLFLYASFSFHLDLGKNPPALILMMVMTAYAAAGFGMFLASIAKSRQQVQMLSTLIVLSMSAIGGSMVPTFMMPAFMQKISVLSVNYWSIQGFYDIYWRNLAFTDPAFLLRPVMLFAIGTGMMILSQVFFRRNVLKLA